MLFAKGIILVEGDAEEIILPLIVKKVFGISLDEFGISLINIRSTGFENVAQLFHDDRIRRRCSIITDLDSPICETIILSTDDDSDKAYKNKVKNSSIKGLERQKRLEEFTKSNVWIRVFYSKYTFEVNFIKDGNLWEVLNIVNKIYSNPATIIQAKKELESDDVSVYGKRVLTMANNEGKGWFAILLGGSISYKTELSDYILDAILFAKESFSKDLISDILSFRLNMYEHDDDKLDFKLVKKNIRDFKEGKVEIKRIVESLEKVIPDDQIIIFLKKI